MRAISERPQHRVDALGVDVLADRDDDLAAVGSQRRRTVSARQTSVRGAPRSNCTKIDGAQIGQWFVHHYAAHALDHQLIAQVAQEQRFIGHLLDHTRLARRDLAGWMAVKTSKFLYVIAVTIGMLYA